MPFPWGFCALLRWKAGTGFSQRFWLVWKIGEMCQLFSRKNDPTCFFSKHLQIRGQDPLGYGIYLIWWKPLLAISCGLPRPTHLGNPGSEFHPELSWLHPAMAAAKFLVSSADTPGVKHLFQPLVLHIGVTRLSSAGCPNSKLTSCLFDWTGFPN